jgi:hypothetical protein
LSQNALGAYLRRIFEALDAETFDAEVDRHFSWDAVSLDRRAWKQITDRLDEVLDWLPELEAEAALRMKESSENPIPATVGLAAFRSPTESELKVLRSRKTRSEWTPGQVGSSELEWLAGTVATFSTTFEIFDATEDGARLLEPRSAGRSAKAARRGCHHSLPVDLPA